MTPIPVVIEAYGHTDPGRMRGNNEDQYLVANLNRSLMVERTSLSFGEQERLHGNFQGTILLVADGMGGESAGDRASHLAVDSIVDYMLNAMPWFFRLDEKLASDLFNALIIGVKQCEASIQDYQRNSSTQGRMGTTLTLAYVLWPNMYVVHVGDSRCYLLRDGQMKQISRDHTVAQLMAEQGKANEDDEQRYGHVLYNAVGADADTPVKPEVFKIELTFGDCVLLCSDGLHGFVSEKRIQNLLESTESASDACEQLIDEANENGGEDNITVVVAHFRKEATVVDEDAPTIVDSESPPAP